VFKPDLILLDVMMPGMDGVEVCRRIRINRQWQSIPIIMITALSTKQDLARCLSAGADDFLSKPVNGVELKARIQSLLRIKAQYDNIQSLCKIQKNTISMLESTLTQLRGNLSSSLSHELNTPLNGIVGVFNLLKDDWEKMERAEIHELLALGNESAHRLEKTTRKILSYLQLELTTKESQEQTYSDLSVDTVHDSVFSHAQSLNRSQDLCLDITAARVSLSAANLSLLLSELVDNALRFSKSGTLVEIRSEIHGDRLYLWVRDRGQGCSANQVKRINNFMSLDQTYGKQQVVGIGLKIVKNILQLVNGQFNLQSTVEQGTTVEIVLAIAPS
jgi:signal transduction histidine kinase